MSSIYSTVTSSARRHQTAVFVRVTPGQSSNVTERQAAFVNSLNRKPNTPQGTIKADVFTVQGTDVRTGLQAPIEGTPAPTYSEQAMAESLRAAGYTVSAPKAVAAPTGRLSSPDLRSYAASAGYTISVIVD